MYKHECTKIFSRKSPYIVFLFIILMMFYVHPYPIEPTMKESIYEDLHDSWGGPVTEEKLLKVREAMRASDAGETTSSTFEEEAESDVYFLVSVSHLQEMELMERKEVLRGEIHAFPEKSYPYKSARKELAMLDKLEQPFSYNVIRAWRGMFDFISPAMTVIFLAILILLGVTPVFTDDYSKQRIDLILASKHGKRRIVTAKIMAVITYVAAILFSLHLVNAIFAWFKFGGLKGWDVPIHGLGALESISFFSFETSPFNLNIWQLYIITIFIQFVGLIAFAILIMLLSILFKNSINTLLVSSLVVGLPFLMEHLEFGTFQRGIFSYITDFNYAAFMKASTLFETFKAYNLFGFPVLYPNVLLLTFGILTAGFIGLIYRRFRKV